MPFPKGIDGSVKLSAGGEKGRCGWLKDKFGLSWQTVPSIRGRDDARPGCFEDSHIIAAVMRTNKLDIADLKRAYDGEAA